MPFILAVCQPGGGVASYSHSRMGRERPGGAPGGLLEFCPPRKTDQILADYDFIINVASTEELFS